MVTLLTRTRHRELHAARMPSTDTGDLTQTFVRLTRQLLTVPSARYTLESFALGDTNDIDHLILTEHLLDGHFLLHFLTGPVNLVGDCSTVHLDLHDVRFLLAFLQEFHLCVRDNTDHFAVLLHHFEIALDLLHSVLILPLLGIVGEGLLLGLVPILVHTALGLLAQMFSEDRLKRAQTFGRIDVANNANYHHWWRFDNGHSLDN